MSSNSKIYYYNPPLAGDGFSGIQQLKPLGSDIIQGNC